MGMVKEFKQFAAQGNMVDMAVGNHHLAQRSARSSRLWLPI
jgi:hypothetical protein